MSSSIDSLSGLAVIAQEVGQVLAEIYGSQQVVSRESWETLREQINDLQVNCAGHMGVLEARASWYELGMVSFERHVVIPAEKGSWPDRTDALNWPSHKWPKELLTGTETLEHFLRRHYLKGSFAHYFSRLEKLYLRISKAPIPDNIKAVYSLKAECLKERLLDGRM